MQYRWADFWSDLDQEPEILVRFIVFDISNSYGTCMQKFRSEAYGVNKSPFLAPLIWSDLGQEPEILVRFIVFDVSNSYGTCMRNSDLRLMG